jgi:hypothetical protein
MPVIITRVWAMPNRCTFSIKPIHDLLERRVYGHSLDPFANAARVATVTNDINPEMGCDYTLDACTFLDRQGEASADTILFDPPYSPRQVSECYKSFGRTVTGKDTQAKFYADAKVSVSRACKPGGTVISFGWNSGGIGKKYGFDIVEILLVPHGGSHNDTICVVEKRSAIPFADLRI